MNKQEKKEYLEWANKFASEGIFSQEETPAQQNPAREEAIAQSTKKAGEHTWDVIALILFIVGIIAAAIGFWFVGIPILVAAAYLAYSKSDSVLGDVLMRVIILAIFAFFARINILPENRTISVFGVTIASMMIIMSLPTNNVKGIKGLSERTKVIFGKERTIIKGGLTTYRTFIYVFCIIFTFVWTGVVFSSNLVVMALTGPLVIASIIWKQPIKAGTKLVGSVICFGPLIFYGIQFLFVAGGAAFGGVVDQAQKALETGLGGSSTGTMMDMILNPKLAVQAQLKPATKKEVSESNLLTLPNVAFTTSGQVIPNAGCYDTSTFQVIGTVKNTGNKHIKDLELSLSKDIEGISEENPCHDIILSNPDPKSISSLPIGVTSQVTSLVDPVKSGGDEGDVTPTHACFVKVSAITGYHGISRLPIEFIDGDYGVSKTQEGALNLKIVPATTSIGPVDLSIGGFQQPVFVYESGAETITMVTTITQTGAGEVEKYISAYLFIPNELLYNGQCAKKTDDWVCFQTITCPNPEEHPILNKVCESFNNFILGFIDGFTQFEYDNSDELLNNDYSICFYNKTIKTNTVNTGTCTLKPSIDILGDDVLRRTLIIRGDVLYTYKVSSSTSFEVRDCEVE